MTTEVMVRPRRLGLWSSKAGPIIILVLALIVVWYAAAVVVNFSGVRDQFEREEKPFTTAALLLGTLNAERPVLPAPHQIVQEFASSVFSYPPTSNRSLLYHAFVTMSATVVGFGLGGALGIGLAVLIVHLRTLEKSLLPWIISSQTIPILALAPIVIVVLGSLGLHGLLPKAIISAYLCFFPVTVGMVKGFNSPDPIHRDLLRTWSASAAQSFRKLRWPSSMPFLFASLKVAIAASLVGAIVGELPTGAQAGLGARLLAGSYYGQTIQIWAALLAAALLAACLVAVVGATERLVVRQMGGAP
jgi:NitT/TauT family transport system permease protein